jgi:flagellar biosynthesis protein FlhF
MQVKKFEAKTMQEALNMVKAELGPDAIILSAKDHKAGFGLLNGQSVEVTAAISEGSLQKKRIAESKLREQDREKYSTANARDQRKYIHKAFTNELEKRGIKLDQPSVKPSLSSNRYIDIEDDHVEPRVEEKVVPQASKKVEKPQDLQFGDSKQIAGLKSEIGKLQSYIAELQANRSVQQVGIFPGAEYGLRYEISPLFKKFKKIGVRETLIAELLQDAQDELTKEQLKKLPLVEAWCVKKIMGDIRITANPYGTKYHCFVGPSGHGKTSSLVKFASDLIVKRKKRVAILTCDSQKVGAIDQMRIFAKILNVPFGVLKGKVDWKEVSKHFDNYDHVFIDYPGMSLKTQEEYEQVKAFLPPESERTTHLVISASGREEATLTSVRRFQRLGFDDLVITKLDESAGFGILYTLQKEVLKPFHSFGVGGHIPEDFEYASRERVIDLMFEISKPVSGNRVIVQGEMA